MHAMFKLILAIAALAPLSAQVSEKAKKVHHEAFVFDGHVHVVNRQFYHGGDIGERYSDGQFDLPRAYPAETKRRLARRVGELYAELMQTTRELTSRRRWWWC